MVDTPEDSTSTTINKSDKTVISLFMIISNSLNLIRINGDLFFLMQRLHSKQVFIFIIEKTFPLLGVNSTFG